MLPALTTFLAPAGAAVGGFFKRIPDWLIMAGIFLLTFVVVDMMAERRGREKQKAKTKLQQAETRADMVERTSEIITEERKHADAALEARDSGERYDTYDQLPDDLKAIAERRTRSGGAGSF
jgi:hypothetical protein